MQNLNAVKFSGLIASALAFGAVSVAHAQQAEAVQYSEDQFSNTSVAVAGLSNSNYSPSLRVNYSAMAGQLPAFAKQAEISARQENISNANSIDKFLNDAPLYANASATDSAKAIVVIAALKTPEFVDAAKQAAGFLGAEQFTAKLTSNFASVKSLAGYNNAYRTASGTINNNLAKIESAQKILHEASYSMQKQAWASVARDKQINLIALANAKSAPKNFTPIADNEFVNNGASEVINDKLFAAAALIAIGNEDGALKLLNFGTEKFCSEDAYLTLRMCVSASKYPFEHSFCLSEHAYSDMNKCVRKALK